MKKELENKNLLTIDRTIVGLGFSLALFAISSSYRISDRLDLISNLKLDKAQYQRDRTETKKILHELSNTNTKILQKLTELNTIIKIKLPKSGL